MFELSDDLPDSVVHSESDSASFSHNQVCLAFSESLDYHWEIWEVYQFTCFCGSFMHSRYGSWVDVYTSCPSYLSHCRLEKISV